MSYRISIIGLTNKSDLKACLLSVQQICGMSKPEAIEGLKNLPFTLVTKASRENAERMIQLFADLQVKVEIMPPLEEKEFIPLGEAVPPKKQSLRKKVLNIVLMMTVVNVVLLLFGGKAIMKHFSSSKTKISVEEKQEWTTDDAETLGVKVRGKKAENHLQQAIELIREGRDSADRAKWKIYGGSGELPKSGEDLLPLPQLERALNLLNNAQILNPDNADVYRWRGYIYQEKGFYDKAKVEYNQGLSLDSSQVDFWNLLGRLEVSKGNYSNADYIFRKSLSIDGENISTLKNLSILHLDHLRDSATALVFLERYLNEHPEFDYDIQALRKAAAIIAWNKYNGRESQELFKIEDDFQKYENQRQQVQKELDSPKVRGDREAELRAKLGLLFLSRGMRTVAEQELQKSLQLKNTQLSLYDKLALIQAQGGNFDEVLGTLKRAIKAGASRAFFPRNQALLFKYYKADNKKARSAYADYKDFGEDEWTMEMRAEGF